VWGLRYIDDLVCRDVDLGGIIERHYALQDPNWNVTAVISTSATVAGRFAYSAYGTPTTLDANFVPASPHLHDWETLFAGYRWDGTLDYCARHRYLNSALGAWISRDPVAITATPSLYEYVR
jgi:RHS repeat-associated protein